MTILKRLIGARNTQGRPRLETTTSLAMRHPAERNIGWLMLGWFWVSVLLVLPNCTFSSPVSSNNGPNLNPGQTPRDSAIFCDIEQERRCATPTDKAMGIRLAAGAVALNTGQPGSNIGLDETPDARARCGGEPEAVIFHGSFPKGFTACVNCGEVVGTLKYPTANAACVAQCLDFFGTVQADGTFSPQNPPTAANQAYCDTHAKVSTNTPSDSCLAGVCTEAGAELPGFLDPRRIPEPVVWTDLINVTASGADLTRTGAAAPDGGGASSQRFTRGDGYVEFSAAAANQAHGIGLSSDPAGCGPPCPDTNPAPASIQFAIGLFSDGRVYIAESGQLVTGPAPSGSFRTYTAGERYRVSLTDNSDGTAKVTYSRIIGACTPGSPCAEELLYTSAAVPPRYPFRVDASIPTQNATLTNVTVVRIQ